MGIEENEIAGEAREASETSKRELIAGIFIAASKTPEAGTPEAGTLGALQASEIRLVRLREL